MMEQDLAWYLGLDGEIASPECRTNDNREDPIYLVQGMGTLKI